MKYLNTAIVLVCWSIVCIAQSPDKAANRIDSIFSSYTLQTPGAAVAVVKDGKVVFQKGYGLANLTFSIPITPQTVFDIASVSKQFTAFTLYLLEREGKLSLDDHVKKYIPEMPAYANSVKLKHLIAHTSGLRDMGAVASLAGFYITDIVTTPQIIKMLNRQSALLAEPGTAFNYCNSGYVLIAEIVRRVSGKTFAQYAREKIFQPLGMNNTLFCDNYQLVVKNKAESYEKDEGSYLHRPSINTTPGPSGLLTSVDDLTKWALNFEMPTVGDFELIRRFDEISRFDNGKKVFVRMDSGDSIFYAKGQFVTNYKGVRRIGHGGHTAAFRTFFGRFPDQHLAIIQLSNDEHNEDLGGRYDIAEFYIKKSFVETISPPSGVASANSPVRTMSPPSSIPGGDLGRFSGKYFSDELDARYSFIEKNNQLVMQHSRLDDMVLRRTAVDTFTGSGPNTFYFEINFIRTSTGEVTGFTISNWGAKNLKFVKQN